MSDGIVLHHDLVGASDGPVLVLVAGLGAQRHWWPPALVDLLAADHRVVLVDNRDVGASPWMDHLEPADARLEALARGETVEPLYALADMAADVVATLDHLGVDQAHVVGSSLGGMVAQHVAFGWSHRTASLTSIMSSTGAPDLPPGDPDVLASLTEETPTHTEEAFVEASLASARLKSNSHLHDEDQTRLRYQRYYRGGLNPDASGRQLLAAVLDGDRTARLRELDVPTLVIHGEVDPMLPVEAGRATAAAVPGAELLVLPEVGHDLPKAVHDEVAAAITDHVAAATRDDAAGASS